MGVVAWTLFVGIVGIFVTMQPPDVLCTVGPALGVDLAEAQAACDRLAAEMAAETTVSLAAQRVGWLMLCVGGLIVAGALARREITAGRVPK
jgi:hypothetical protein